MILIQKVFWLFNKELRCKESLFGVSEGHKHYMTFLLCIWYVLPAPVSSWLSIVTCWKIIKVETMQSSIRMMWPAMIILCVPDVLHIIFSLSSSSSSQARSSLFCQWLTLYLEKRTATAGVLARRTVCFLGLGLGTLREPQPMGYSISCYLTCYNLSVFLLITQKLLSNVQERNSRTVPEAKKMCFY